MKQRRTSSVKVLGNPDSTGWSQVYDFRPGEEKKCELRGHLHAVISTGFSPGGGVAQARVGREMLTRLHEEYFGSLDDGAYEVLGRAVKKVADEFSTEGVLVEIGTVAIVDDVVYMASSNGAAIYLLREGRLVLVLPGEKGKVGSGSGWLQAGDMFVVGTSGFFGEFSRGVIKGALESGGLGGFAEAILPVLHAKERASSLAALVIGVEIEPQVVEDLPKAPQIKRPRVGLRRRIAGLVDRVLMALPEGGITRRRIVVRDELQDIETKRRRKSAPLVGVVLLVLLAVSIVFGLRQRRLRQFRESYESRLLRARHEFDEAKALAGLNMARARELLISSREIGLELQAEGIDDDELNQLLGEIGVSMGEIAGIYEVQTELFLDLALVSSGFSGDVLDMSDGRMLVLDRAGKKVVGIEIGTKKTEVVSGPDYFDDALSVAGYSGRSFVLSSDGIREVGDEVELVVKSDWDAGQVLMSAFAGNLYVLEKLEGMIWRYPGVRLGFSERQEWLGAGESPDFSNVTAWAIDGSIWILTERGKVLKYSLGSPQSFSLSGPTQFEMQASDVFTDEEQEYLYLLDRGGARVLVFEKNGEYAGEYSAEKLGGASQIVVSEEEKRLVFLAEGKLWEIGLGK